MANTKTWPDPDTQVAQQGRADVHGVYLLDPATQKAVTPATGGGGGGTVTVADGADVTQGTSTDANTVASVMGRLTKIRDLLNATLTVGGTITEANSAAIAINTTGIATQATLAQIKTDLDSLVTNTADLLADGDFLTTIATNTTGVATAANQSTANTSLASIKTDLDEIAIDTDNLATIAGAITSAKMQANVTQIGGQSPTLDNTTIQAVSLRGKGNGTAGDTAVLLDSAGRLQQVQILGTTALSDTNPEPNISNIQQMMINGKAYSCSTGLVTAAANEACSFFVPNTNTTKNILIWSVRLMYSNASQTTDMRLITADDTNITAGTSDAGNVTNLKVGGSASGSSFAMHHASAVTAPASGASTLPLDEILNPVNATVECLAPGMFIYVPPSTAGGVSLYSATTAAGKWQVVIRWVEY